MFPCKRFWAQAKFPSPPNSPGGRFRAPLATNAGPVSGPFSGPQNSDRNTCWHNKLRPFSGPQNWTAKFSRGSIFHRGTTLFLRLAGSFSGPPDRSPVSQISATLCMFAASRCGNYFARGRLHPMRGATWSMWLHWSRSPTVLSFQACWPLRHDPCTLES